MSRIYNIMDKKLVFVIEAKSEDAQHIKDWITVERHKSENIDNEHIRYVVVDKQSPLIEIVNAIKAYCLKLSDVYIAKDVIPHDEDDDNVIVTTHNDNVMCTTLIKVTEEYPEIKKWIEDYTDRVDEIIVQGNIKNGVIDPIINADYLMSLAMPVFENPRKLSKFRNTVRAMVKDLNDRCLLEPAKDLNPKRLKNYSYLRFTYWNYLHSIEYGYQLNL